MTRRRLRALAWRRRRGLLALASLAVAAGCGGEVTKQAQHDGGVEPPLDAGLQPDAKLEDCVSDEGVRLCGTKVGCYQNGPACECKHVPTTADWDGGVPEFGVCLASVNLDLRVCGTCYDGQVCIDLFWDDGPVCASESLGRLFWKHGQGDRVFYADFTPYTGEPLPEPADCPPPKGDLALCGGNCGGCGAKRFCSGRSPTHPWGICVDYAQCDGSSYCGDGKACLLLAAGTQKSWEFYPSLCVSADACSGYAASVPGGATCK